MKNITWNFRQRYFLIDGTTTERDVSQPRQSGLDIMMPVAIRRGISHLMLDGSRPVLAGQDQPGRTVKSILMLEIIDIDGRSPRPAEVVDIAEKMGVAVPHAFVTGRRRERSEDLFNEADFGDWTVAASNGWEDEDEDRLVRQVFLEHKDLKGPSRMIRFAVNFEEGFSFPVGEPEFNLPDDPTSTFGYYVNLDERGTFYADVRNSKGKTVFEISSDEDGGIDLIKNGFMKNKDDIGGLQEHLASLGVIPANAELCESAAFEAKIADMADTAPAGPDF